MKNKKISVIIYSLTPKKLKQLMKKNKLKISFKEYREETLVKRKCNYNKAG
jgi:hypothetical protein